MQQSVLPVRCMECGATFDLWYDLSSGGEIGEVEHLCWSCREKESKRFKRVEEFEQSLEEDSLDEIELNWG